MLCRFEDYEPKMLAFDEEQHTALDASEAGRKSMEKLQAPKTSNVKANGSFAAH